MIHSKGLYVSYLRKHMYIIMLSYLHNEIKVITKGIGKRQEKAGDKLTYHRVWLLSGSIAQTMALVILKEKIKSRL